MTDEFPKYHKIHRMGMVENADIFNDPTDRVCIDEKIDGANFRFKFTESNDRIIFGSRNRSIGDSTQVIGGNFHRATEYIKELTVKLKERDIIIGSNYIFYGEATIKHTMSYDFDKMSPVLGFDIFDLTSQQYLNQEDRVRMFKQIGLPMVPLILTCTVKELEQLDESIIPESAYAKIKAEGVVIKNYDSDLYCKIVTEKFKEMNKEAFGNSIRGARKANEQTELFIATYCPDIRIEKQIHSLIDNGEFLSMVLMKQLPKLIWTDIVEEESKTICNSNMSIDFKNVRCKIANRCAIVLKRLIKNHNLNNK